MTNDTTKETAATYNRQAKNYSAAAERPMAQIRLATIRRALHAISPSIRPGHKIVDLGCGTGQSTEAIRKIFRTQKILGLDCSVAEIRIAKKRSEEENLDIEYLIGDLFNHAFQDDSVNLLVAVMSIHYFQGQARLREFLQLAASVLTDDGQIAIQIPNPALPLPYRDYGIEHVPVGNFDTEIPEDTPYTVKLYRHPLRSWEKDWGEPLVSFTNFRHALETYKNAFEAVGFQCCSQPVVVPENLMSQYSQEHWSDFIEEPIYWTFIAKKQDP